MIPKCFSCGTIACDTLTILKRKLEMMETELFIVMTNDGDDDSEFAQGDDLTEDRFVQIDARAICILLLVASRS